MRGASDFMLLMRTARTRGASKSPAEQCARRWALSGFNGWTNVAAGVGVVCRDLLVVGVAVSADQGGHCGARSGGDRVCAGGRIGRRVVAGGRGTGRAA